VICEAVCGSCSCCQLLLSAALWYLLPFAGIVFLLTSGCCCSCRAFCVTTQLAVGMLTSVVEQRAGANAIKGRGPCVGGVCASVLLLHRQCHCFCGTDWYCDSSSMWFLSTYLYPMCNCSQQDTATRSTACQAVALPSCCTVQSRHCCALCVLSASRPFVCAAFCWLWPVSFARLILLIACACSQCQLVGGQSRY
jgi:hypothetical protein